MLQFLKNKQSNFVSMEYLKYSSSVAAVKNVYGQDYQRACVNLDFAFYYSSQSVVSLACMTKSSSSVMT